ncbi:2-hydroxy-3-oxopropionate reductase [Clostridium sp. MCC353]|uniref:2-hydroxy-3-oxopropionate reductase n=1 Tax=Clostridium sp. MCC353 TaxID=2592646 RepID=UPI001C029C51|nr:2-hydroxy-3-oxopropionate reductase [Clostridium sp. MCC353]MBT9779297.1 2-hydroxy-3-oxopropionate reductase [Clostridium sp. MCC353]
MEKAGFIGLGIMGRPMAENLLKSGMPLMVYDINQDAVAQLVSLGAEPGNPEEIGAACEVIFTILPNGAIVQDVLFGENGAAKGLAEGKIVCDCSSVTPAESRNCYERLEKMGVGFVDAPVSGGEPGAVNGTLAFMAGGREEDFNRLRPFFDIMGASALLIGESGSGSVTKLANQVIVNLTIAAVSEAFVLAVKAGADPVKVFEAIKGGLAGSAVLNAKIPMIVERNFKPGGKISINHKDIKNVLATAHDMDVPMPFSSQLFEVMQALKVSGHMDEDHGGIVQYFEQLAGVEVKKAD